MKKTSFILLTLMASFSVTMSVAQTDSVNNIKAPDFIYDADKLNTTRPNNDTIRRDSVRRDTVVMIQQPVVYDYYYRSRFWNFWYRVWAPNSYYRAIHRPGFVPPRLRTEHAATSHVRGGFGRTGSYHPVVS